ncbi:cation:proton antiporter [Streptomyces sp. NPDC059783]|uniref:cation:proton antiporter domain-containing protein n=1 Tax=Streptomyces sp. NPDC059783 TaxID=3346944 RepID=UPI0036610CD4
MPPPLPSTASRSARCPPGTGHCRTHWRSCARKPQEPSSWDWHLASGFAVRRLLRLITLPAARRGITLLVPFAVYLAADAVHASGVLAVLTAALTTDGHRTGDGDRITDRLDGAPFWDTVELLAAGTAFGLIGLQLRTVLPAVDDLPAAAGQAAAVCATVLAVRFAWSLWVCPVLQRLPGAGSSPATAGWRESLVLAWCGARGLATTALALALPAGTPARDELVLVAFAVVVTTLVLPTLTLPRLAFRLGVLHDEATELSRARALALRASAAALTRLRELDHGLSPHAVNALRERQRDVLLALDAPNPSPDGEQDRIRWAEEQMLAAARQEILLHRAETGTETETADTVLRHWDLHSTRTPA